jgi:hypothetical protein
MLLTDSAIESSSGWRNRLDALFCLRLCWLLRGAGEALEEEPDAELPRCWPKKLGVNEGAWPCRGEVGPAGAEALEAAADGGLEDMVPPARVEWRGGGRQDAAGVELGWVGLVGLIGWC